jgi:hypothetical protein
MSARPFRLTDDLPGLRNASSNIVEDTVSGAGNLISGRYDDTMSALRPVLQPGWYRPVRSGQSPSPEVSKTP